MGEPELIKDLIPENYFQKAQIDVNSHEDLKERFGLVLRGYEKFNLQEFLQSHKYLFEAVLQDMLKCIQCDGNCHSGIHTNGGIPIYQGLDYEYIRVYHQPAVKAIVCPGAAERKRQIKEQLTSGKLHVSQDVSEIPNQNTGKQFAEFREKLLRPNVVSIDKKRREREWLP